MVVSVHYRIQFSKDSFSTGPQFTHISVLNPDTNALSQSPSKGRPHPTTMMMSQNITLQCLQQRPANHIIQKAKKKYPDINL